VYVIFNIPEMPFPKYGINYPITVIGYAGCIVMFIVATGLIAKFSENTSKTYAVAAVAFLFLYVLL
jgi:hypothetical protein